MREEDPVQEQNDAISLRMNIKENMSLYFNEYFISDIKFMTSNQTVINFQPIASLKSGVIYFL